MRTLVEQTAREAREWLLRLARKCTKPRDGSDLRWLALHSPIILMGGEDVGEWDIYPEKPAILVGTQDMLLSRALNRGYGMSRYRWPMHFGLLNNDCLWVMDETQLMGVGVETSAQLDAFRHDAKMPTVGACPTWWMSATLLELRGPPPAYRTAETLSLAEQALVADLVADGLSIQDKFRPEPHYKQTGKYHYEGKIVEEIRETKQGKGKQP
jgi:hypothetical protein